MRATVSVGPPAGNGTTMVIGRVARAAPDGYTVGIGHWSTHVVNGAIYQLPYDVLNDFEPISLVAANAQLAVVRKSLPANNLKELIDWLKANPDKASQGTAGAGSASHVSGAYFQKATGTRFQFVPYRGTGPAMQDLVAGQIDLMFDQAANSLPQVRNGNVKAFAVTEGHAEGHQRQAHRCGRGGFGRSRGASPAGGTRPGHSAARPADARGAARASQGRDREVVADHQGRQHQRRVIRRNCVTGNA